MEGEDDSEDDRLQSCLILYAMNFSFIPREKAESLAQSKPFLLSRVTLSSPDTEFLMITRYSLFSTTFDLAFIIDGEIVYISDEDLRGGAEEYIRKGNQE